MSSTLHTESHGTDKSSYYRISAVSNLTGLPANTIRTWERRYKAVTPKRSEGGTRLYSEEDITRLQLIRALCQCRENISSVASLELSQLRERLAMHTHPSDAHVPEIFLEIETRIAIVDNTLPEQLRSNTAESGSLQVVASATTVDELSHKIPAHVSLDALIVRLSSLGDRPVEVLDRLKAVCSPRMVLVLHDFTTRRILKAVSQTGARLIHAQISVSSLRQIIEDHLTFLRVMEASNQPLAQVATPVPKGIPRRRFHDDQLARLREHRSEVKCECPNHLSSLVSALASFEEYSRRCENQTPADAALHAQLYQGTATARAAMEDLLQMLCKYENIDT